MSIEEKKLVDVFCSLGTLRKGGPFNFKAQISSAPALNLKPTIRLWEFCILTRTKKNPIRENFQKILHVKIKNHT